MSVSYTSLLILGVPILESKQIKQIQKFNEDTGASQMKDVEKTIYIIEGTNIEIDPYNEDECYTIGNWGCISTGMNKQFFVGMLVSSTGSYNSAPYEFINFIEDKKNVTADYLKDTFGYTGEVYTILSQSAG